MNRPLLEILEAVQSGQMQAEEAARRISGGAYAIEDLATLDLGRVARRGFTESVLCEGKTPEQAARIFRELIDRSPDDHAVMATRAQDEHVRLITHACPKAEFYPEARIIARPAKEPAASQGRIAIVSAGTADRSVAEEAAVTAALLGSNIERFYDVGVAGIHRLFAVLDRIRKARAVIVVAGMDAALSSVVAGLISRPLIAVPSSTGYGAALGGVSALLSMLNSCAPGVAVVNIDNGYGAACLATMICQKDDEEQ